MSERTIRVRLYKTTAEELPIVGVPEIRHEKLCIRRGRRIVAKYDVKEVMYYKDDGTVHMP